MTAQVDEADRREAWIVTERMVYCVAQKQGAFDLLSKHRKERDE